MKSFEAWWLEGVGTKAGMGNGWRGVARAAWSACAAEHQAEVERLTAEVKKLQATIDFEYGTGYYRKQREEAKSAFDEAVRKEAVAKRPICSQGFLRFKDADTEAAAIMEDLKLGVKIERWGFTDYERLCGVRVRLVRLGCKVEDAAVFDFTSKYGAISVSPPEKPATYATGGMVASALADPDACASASVICGEDQPETILPMPTKISNPWWRTPGPPVVTLKESAPPPAKDEIISDAEFKRRAGFYDGPKPGEKDGR